MHGEDRANRPSQPLIYIGTQPLFLLWWFILLRQHVLILDITLKTQLCVADILQLSPLPFMAHHPETALEQDNVRHHMARLFSYFIHCVGILPRPIRSSIFSLI